MAILKLPYLNPVHFSKMTPDEVEAYVSRHIDNRSFVDTILSFEQQVFWPQMWQKSDTIKLQVQSTYSPIVIKQCRCNGEVVATTSMTQVRQNEYDPTLFIYEKALPQNLFEEGMYYLQMEVGSGGDVVLVSEQFKLSEKIENSLLIEYFHREFKDGVFFETGFLPSIRVPGVIKLKQPTSSNADYEDEDNNLVLLKGVGYEVEQLTVGVCDENPAGIPPYLIKKLNRIFTLSNISIDGREKVKNGDAEFEETSEADYPLSSWAIELRDKIRRDSVIYEDDVVIDGKFSVVLVADSKGFGSQGTGSDYFIQDVE